MNYKNLMQSIVETYYTSVVKNPEKLALLKLEKKGIWKDDGSVELEPEKDKK